MAKSDAKSNRHLQSVKERGYANLKCTAAEIAAKTPEELIRVLCAEGEELLSAKTTTGTTSPESKRLNDTLATADPNPYVRARVKILNDLPKSRREQIEAMEKTNNTNNPTYAQFLKLVTKLGDQFSNKTS